MEKCIPIFHLLGHVWNFQTCILDLHFYKDGGGNFCPTDTKIYFLIGKHTSNPPKLLDFLHFGLTNPMVPNLAHVFILGWV